MTTRTDVPASKGEPYTLIYQDSQHVVHLHRASTRGNGNIVSFSIRAADVVPVCNALVDLIETGAAT